MFKKVCSKFFTILSLSLILSSVFPTEIFAQTSEVVRQETIPLSVKILNTAYSSEKRLVSIDFSVQNNSESFVDNLKYSFEFYNGEKLEESGLLFRNLDYIVSKSDSFPRLSPGESVRQTIKYELPATIPGGSYFIRAVVHNPEVSSYGITYTKEPLRLTGRGTFISEKKAELVDIENKKTYQLMEGPTLEKNKSYAVSFPRSSNDQLFGTIDKESVYADIKISHISDQEKIVYEKKDILLDDLIREDGDALEFKIDPWENILSGAHTAVISFKNARGEQIAENTLVRLLYRGLIGRIYEAQTNINSYRKGEPINLIVNTVLAGDTVAKKAFLKAVFKNQGEIVQEVEKEIELNGTFEGIDTDVDFKDKKIKSKTLIDQIELTLTDENGNILDTQIVTMDSSKIFEYPKSTLLKNLLWSLLALVVIVGLLAFLKKKTNFTFVSVAITFVLIGGSILISNDNLVSAQSQTWGCMDATSWNYNPAATNDDGSCHGNSNDTNSNDYYEYIGDYIDIWSVPDGEPEGYQGLCSADGGCSEVEFYVKVSCKACANSPTDVTVNFYNNKTDLQTKITWNNQVNPSVNGPTESIFGPFTENFCFDVDNTQSTITDGILSQDYRLESKANFGGDYCQHSDYNAAFSGVSRSDRSMSCALDAEIRSSFYLDDNEDGDKDSDEPYIKSPDAPSYCLGIESIPLGAVRKLYGDDLGDLIPEECSSPDDIPYFFKTVELGNYIVGLDLLNAFGWQQTGADYFSNGVWLKEQNNQGINYLGRNYFPVNPGETLFTRVGLKNTNPVALSCAYAPGEGWYVDNFYSDDYTQEELDYVWDGDVDPDSGSPSSGGVIYTPPTEPPTTPPTCTASASVTITNVVTTLEACYPHEKDMCGGLNAGKNYTITGVSLSLRDPCHTGELWFINTNFDGNRVRTDTRKHGDSWDVPINRAGYLSGPSDTDRVTVDGWTRSSRINQGATRTVSASESITLELCDCEWCDQQTNSQGWESSNYGKNEICQFVEPPVTVIAGCNDSRALNYNPNATHFGYINPFTGISDLCDMGGGCREVGADNRESWRSYDDGSCTFRNQYDDLPSYMDSTYPTYESYIAPGTPLWYDYFQYY